MTISAVYEAIKPYIHRTPIMTSRLLDGLSGARLFFKCENFQRMGAFKMRGAMNAVLQLCPQQRAKGVATHSSGNFAQALSLAAREVGIPAYIVMPSNSPEVKKAAVRDYGGIIVECPPTQSARQAAAAEITQRTGAAFIHPYNDMDVICGQGTAAWELLEDYPDLDFIISPVGGGGLVSGTILAAREKCGGSTLGSGVGSTLGNKGGSTLGDEGGSTLGDEGGSTIGDTGGGTFGNGVGSALGNVERSGCRVIGAEPASVDDAARSLLSGRIEENPADAFTIADGLRTTLGDKTFPIIYTGVEGIITVSEQEIVSAMRLLWERMKIVVEPSGALPFAALLHGSGYFEDSGNIQGPTLSGNYLHSRGPEDLYNPHPFDSPENMCDPRHSGGFNYPRDRHCSDSVGRFRGKKVGIILSGGNVDLAKLPFG